MGKGDKATGKKSGDKGKSKSDEATDKGSKVSLVISSFPDIEHSGPSGQGRVEGCDSRQRAAHSLRETFESDGGAPAHSGMRYLFAIGPLLNVDPSCPQAGERFDKVAQECSEDKAKGL
jgi:hypothetical protein